MITLWRCKFIMQIFHIIKLDLITTLTYILMDNFCPCFIYRVVQIKVYDRVYILNWVINWNLFVIFFSQTCFVLLCISMLLFLVGMKHFQDSRTQVFCEWYTIISFLDDPSLRDINSTPIYNPPVTGYSQVDRKFDEIRQSYIRGDSLGSGASHFKT